MKNNKILISTILCGVLMIGYVIWRNWDTPPPEICMTIYGETSYVICGKDLNLDGNLDLDEATKIERIPNN